MRRSIVQNVGAGAAVIVAVAGAGLWRGLSHGAAAEGQAAAAPEAAPVPSPLPSSRAPQDTLLFEATRAPDAVAPAAFPNAPENPSPHGASEAPSEAALMTELRALGSSDAGRTVELARDGNRRFPDSADAPERTSALIHALASEGRTSEARGEAEDMVNHYPDSDWVREIEGFTGAHRHRNIRVRPDGKLEYY